MRPVSVSIIVPAYVASTEQRDLLDETLTSVDRQSNRDFEVIVIDDGSPIDVTAVARRPRTRVIRQANAGPAIARNTGIAASQGRCLVFLDADDHLLSDALDAGLEALDVRSDAGFAIGAREEMTHAGVPVPWPVPAPPPQTHVYRPLLAFDWYIIPPSSAMFRREVVQQIGGFREPWGADDLDFYLRAAWRFPVHCYQSPPVTRYRRYSTSSSRDGERMLRSIRAVYARQRPLVLGDPALEHAYARGMTELTRIFRDCLVENVADRVRAHEWARAWRAMSVLAREQPARLVEVARHLGRDRDVRLTGTRRDVDALSR
jgi:glycosyltransferase involved in cell wall biosynthesis